MAGNAGQRGNQIVFKAAAIANVPIYEVELAESLLDEIVSILGVGEDPWGARLRTILPNQARSYFMAKVLLNADSPHRSRKTIMRMVASLTRALEAMEEIGMDQSMALAILLDRSDGPNASRSLIEIRKIIESFRDVAASWTEMYQPKDRRPRNRALELHVGALMLLFEWATGNRAKASLKRTGSHEPRLTSPEARAIHMLLNAVDKDATETAIANKIVEIRRERKGKSLGYYGPILLAGAPGYAIP